jgi:serpin B
MKLNGWICHAKNQLVDIQLPKFRQSGRYDMNMALAALGARQMFNPDQADLTGIAKPRAGRRLYVGDVIHEAQVDVDENGTEASAATAVTTLLSLSAPEFPPPQPIAFIADHPFIYAIIDQRTGAILFMGRESNPTQSEE